MHQAIQCIAITKAKKQCSKVAKQGQYCNQHALLSIKVPKIADVTILATLDMDEARWEQAYQAGINPKYNKDSKKLNTSGYDMPGVCVDVPIFLIPRQRGQSYKSIPLEGVDNDLVFYAPISKGFSGQGISSFSLGPIVGEGLCLVNSAFSKIICTFHLEGGGKVNIKRKYNWQRSKEPTRSIIRMDDVTMLVDDIPVNTTEWLEDNKELWFDEWQKWSHTVAMSSTGSFGWRNGEDIITFKYGNRYLSFVQWKKECYIKPSYNLLPLSQTFQDLKLVWDMGHPLGLVHPKAITGNPEQQITKEYIRELYDSFDEMCCQPFVIAGLLLGVPIDDDT